MSKFYLISPLVLQTFIWPFTRLVFWFFGRWEIRGAENLKNLDKSRGVIFAANHSSELDPILVPAALPFLSPLSPMFYTSRDKSFYKTSGWRQAFYGGCLFKIWGAHQLNSGKKNYAVSLSTHIKILRAGKSVCIFPEGRKTRDGNLQEARGGVAYLSAKLGCAVAPVYLSGIFNLSAKDFFLRRKKIIISFGKPLLPKDIFGNGGHRNEVDYKAGSAVVISKIAELKKQN